MIAIVFAGLTLLAESPLTIVADGRSDYVIYRDPAAVHNYRPLAADLQRLIKAATGVELPVVDQPAARMLAIGDGPALRAAGLSPEGMPDDGLRMVTRGGCLYLFGPDTPAGETHPRGGASRGTNNAVYAFCERFLGVRWLMPGAVGEDVPRLAGLVIPPTDLTDAPDFACRRLQYVQERRADVRQWWDRQKLEGVLRVGHGHAWDMFPPQAVLAAHPEYLALVGGQRAAPEYRKGVEPYKFCLTDAGLIQAFADSVAEWLDQHPTAASVSIAPSDGGGWCECARCAAAVEKAPSAEWGNYGPYGHSRTRPLIDFYNRVGPLVAKRHPGKPLGTYVYASYLYPPAEPVKVSDNIFLVIAPRTYYGLTLYKDQYRDEFRRLIAAWGRTVEHYGYSDYPTWLRNYTGAPLAPARSILKLIFPTLKANRCELVYLCGLEAWGYGGVHNYLVAKQMWHAEADVDALYREYLDRAYGPGAAAMDRLYTLLDEKMAEYERASTDFNYEMTADLIGKVYLPNFAAIESLYLEARSMAATPAQQQRVEMLGENLKVLHYLIRQGGLFEHPERSAFYLSDADYDAFWKSTRQSLAQVYAPNPDFGQQYGGMTRLFLPEQRRLTIPRRPEATPPPEIDADLSDPAWRQAAVADDFREIGRPQPHPVPTTVRALYDRDYLYLAIECTEPDAANVKAVCTVRDSDAIYHDDCVEIFINQVANVRRFWHFTLSPANTQWDAFVDQANQNVKWASATAVKAPGWVAEVRLPIAGLEVRDDPAGRTWRVNLAREDKPAGVNTSWNKVEATFLEPHNFGLWELAR